MASRKAFSSSATDPDPAEPLLGAVAWPSASPEASTTKHIFSNNLIERILLCLFVLNGPFKVIIPGPKPCSIRDPVLIFRENSGLISHHSCPDVHSYVQQRY